MLLQIKKKTDQLKYQAFYLKGSNQICKVSNHSWLLNYIEYQYNFFEVQSNFGKRSNPIWSLKQKYFFILIVSSSEPSAHSSRPLLTHCFGIHEPLQYLSSGLLQPSTLPQFSRINSYTNFIPLDFFDLYKSYIMGDNLNM